MAKIKMCFIKEDVFKLQKIHIVCIVCTAYTILYKQHFSVNRLLSDYIFKM